MAKQKGNRMIANNKKAYHDYFIEDNMRPVFPLPVPR